MHTYCIPAQATYHFRETSGVDPQPATPEVWGDPHGSTEIKWAGGVNRNFGWRAKP